MVPDRALIRLRPEERAVLEARLRAPAAEQRLVFRARIVFLAAEGRSTRSIARAWRHAAHCQRLARAFRPGGARRFRRQGAGPGPARKYGTETGLRILALLHELPPKDYARWTGPLTAASAGPEPAPKNPMFCRAKPRKSRAPASIATGQAANSAVFQPTARSRSRFL